MLTFVVPVRHPENARDWGRVKLTLTQTAASIASRDSDQWRAVVVANTGSDLPPQSWFTAFSLLVAAEGLRTPRPRQRLSA